MASLDVRRCGLCGRWFDHSSLAFNGWYLSCPECINIRTPQKARSLGDSHALNGQAAPEEICRQSLPGGEEIETVAILANIF
jgi:hypothetical protein